MKNALGNVNNLLEKIAIRNDFVFLYEERLIEDVGELFKQAIEKLKLTYRLTELSKPLTG